MSKTQPLYTRDIELLEAGVNKVETQTVGNQTWSRENLCVESYHEEILYYTTRWDAFWGAATNGFSRPSTLKSTSLPAPR